MVNLQVYDRLGALTERAISRLRFDHRPAASRARSAPAPSCRADTGPPPSRRNPRQSAAPRRPPAPTAVSTMRSSSGWLTCKRSRKLAWIPPASACRTLRRSPASIAVTLLPGRAPPRPARGRRARDGRGRTLYLSRAAPDFSRPDAAVDHQECPIAGNRNVRQPHRIEVISDAYPAREPSDAA